MDVMYSTLCCLMLLFFFLWHHTLKQTSLLQRHRGQHYVSEVVSLRQVIVLPSETALFFLPLPNTQYSFLKRFYVFSSGNENKNDCVSTYTVVLVSPPQVRDLSNLHQHALQVDNDHGTKHRLSHWDESEGRQCVNQRYLRIFFIGF